MSPKLSKLIIIASVLVLLAVAAVLALRAGLPWSYMISDWFIHTSETPTMDDSIASIQTTPPVKTSAPVDAIATSGTISGQIDPSVACFTIEQPPAFAFLPDSSELLVRASAGIQVFDLETGALEAFIKSSQNLIAAALSPDGETIAWSLTDNTIQLVNRSDQEVLRTLSGHTDMVTKLRFSPGGDLLVSASHDYTVRVWNLSVEEVRTIQTDALGIGISPDGNLIATVPFDGPVALWDLATGEKVKELGGYGGYDTSDAEFSPDGQYLATDLANGLHLWQISDVRPVWNDLKNSMAIAFSPDGRYLAYSDIEDGNKVVLATADGTQYLREIDRMQSPVWELFFSPDASLLAITDGMEIHIRQVDNGALLALGKTSCP